MMVTWHSLATFSRNKLDAWGVPVSPTDSAAFLHLWQVTAHMLGIRDEYIPATWAEANAQSRQVLDPILAPTYEGRALAKTLLNLAAEYDQGLSKPMLHSFTRYCLGHQIADLLEVPRELTDSFVSTGWPPFVAFREAMSAFPFAPKGYWTFDEFLRLAVLFFLGEGRPINITMPTGQQPALLMRAGGFETGGFETGSSVALLNPRWAFVALLNHRHTIARSRPVQ